MECDESTRDEEIEKHPVGYLVRDEKRVMRKKEEEDWSTFRTIRTTEALWERTIRSGGQSGRVVRTLKYPNANDLTTRFAARRKRRGGKGEREEELFRCEMKYENNLLVKQMKEDKKVATIWFELFEWAISSIWVEVASWAADLEDWGRRTNERKWFGEPDSSGR
jgi:hypothetical protein